MAVKISKSNIRVSQAAQDNDVSILLPSISSGDGNELPDGSDVDIDSAAPSKLLENVINKYGLTASRPVIIGSFDFAPMFSDDMTPTRASEMFDLQSSTSKLLVDSAQSLQRRIGKENRRDLKNRRDRKIDEAEDLISVLGQLTSISEYISKSLNFKNEDSASLDFLHLHELMNCKHWLPESLSIHAVLRSCGIHSHIINRMSGTQKLVQLTYELHMTLLHGTGSWNSRSARLEAFMKKYEYDSVDEMTGNELVPFSDNSYYEKMYLSNPLSVEFNQKMGNNWTFLQRLKKLKLSRPNQDLEGYFGKVMSMISQDMIFSENIRTGAMISDDYDVSFGKAFIDVNNFSARKSVIKCTGIITDVAQSGNVSTVEKTAKSPGITSNFFINESLNHGISSISRTSLPFDMSSSGMDATSLKIPFIDMSYESGTFGSFKELKSFAGSIDDSRPKQMAMIEKYLLAPNTGHSFSSEGERLGLPNELVRIFYIKISSWTKAVGFSKSSSFKFGDYTRSESVKLAITQAASKDENIKKDLLDLLIQRERTRITGKQFKSDLAKSAQEPELSKNIDINAKREKVRDSQHIGGTLKVEEKKYKKAMNEIEDENKHYYKAINKLADSSEAYFLQATTSNPSTSPLFDTAMINENKVAGLTLKKKRLTYSIVKSTKTYTKERVRNDDGQNGEGNWLNKPVVSDSTKISVDSSPIKLGLVPHESSPNTIFDVPRKITKSILNSQGSALWNEVLGPHRGAYDAGKTSVLFDMNYWTVYRMVCIMVIDYIGENFNFGASYNPDYTEDFVFSEKNMYGNSAFVPPPPPPPGVAEDTQQYINSIVVGSSTPTALLRQTQDSFAFEWSPVQFAAHGSKRIIKSLNFTLNNPESVLVPEPPESNQEKLGFHYAARAKQDILNSMDRHIKSYSLAICSISKPHDTIKKVNRNVKTFTPEAGAIGGYDNFYEAINTDEKFENYITTLSQMQSINRSRALYRIKRKDEAKMANSLSKIDVVQKIKKRQILSMMTDAKFRLKTKRPGDENRKIFTIGMPSGMLESLRMKSHDEKYIDSFLIKIDIFKRDLRNDAREFKPKSVIFDMKLFADGSLEDIDLDELTISDDGKVFNSFQLENLDEDDAISLFEDTVNKANFFRHGTNKLKIKGRGPMGFSKRKYQSGDVERVITWGNRHISKSCISDLARNHVVDDLLKAFIKTTSGVDLYEDSFIIGSNSETFSGIDKITGRKRPGDTLVEPTFNNIIEENFLKERLISASAGKRIQVLGGRTSPKRLGREFDVSNRTANNEVFKINSMINTLSKFEIFHSDHLKNRIIAPKLFERIFCFVVDPISDFEEIQENEESTAVLSQQGPLKFPILNSTLFNTPEDSIRENFASSILEAHCYDFFVTVSLLPSE
jgi:hypothetical protein